MRTKNQTIYMQLEACFVFSWCVLCSRLACQPKIYSMQYNKGSSNNNNKKHAGDEPSVAPHWKSRWCAWWSLALYRTTTTTKNQRNFLKRQIKCQSMSEITSDRPTIVDEHDFEIFPFFFLRLFFCGCYCCCLLLSKILSSQLKMLKRLNTHTRTHVRSEAPLSVMKNKMRRKKEPLSFSTYYGYFYCGHRVHAREFISGITRRIFLLPHFYVTGRWAGIECKCRSIE